MIADAPQVFTHDGTEYTGTISGLNLSRRLEIGGFEEGPLMTLVVALIGSDGADTFPNVPAVGDHITVDDMIYRVDRTEIDPFSQGLQLDLVSPNR